MFGLMQFARHTMHCSSRIAICLLLLGSVSAPVLAWGPEGHAVIGILALERLQP